MQFEEWKFLLSPGDAMRYMNDKLRENQQNGRVIAHPCLLVSLKNSS